MYLETMYIYPTAQFHNDEPGFSSGVGLALENMFGLGTLTADFFYKVLLRSRANTYK